MTYRRLLCGIFKHTLAVGLRGRVRAQKTRLGELLGWFVFLEFRLLPLFLFLALKIGLWACVLVEKIGKKNFLFFSFFDVFRVADYESAVIFLI